MEPAPAAPAAAAPQQQQQHQYRRRWSDVQPGESSPLPSPLRQEEDGGGAQQQQQLRHRRKQSIPESDEVGVCLYVCGVVIRSGGWMGGSGSQNVGRTTHSHPIHTSNITPHLQAYFSSSDSTDTPASPSTRAEEAAALAAQRALPVESRRRLGGFETLFAYSVQYGLGCIYYVVDMEGPADAELLKESMRLQVKRHPNLRSRIVDG